MKKIINRVTIEPFKDPVSARYMVQAIKLAYPNTDIEFIEAMAEKGRTSDFVAKKDLVAIKEKYLGYISLFSGCENCGLEGHKALFIGVKNLPHDFEKNFHNYVVVGQ